MNLKPEDQTALLLPVRDAPLAVELVFPIDRFYIVSGISRRRM